MTTTIGRVLSPAPAGSWDDWRTSCPVVHREANQWNMWYYGHDHHFPGLLETPMSSLPMGRSGLAVSPDGLHWDRVAGPGVQGSVIDPSHNPARFDSFQVGVTDVVRAGDEYRLYFMGTMDDISERFGRVRKGATVAIGMARSTDGIHFTKVDGTAGGGAIFARNTEPSWDDISVGFPKVLALPGGGWRMYYNGSGSTGQSGIGVAESADGIHWDRRGLVFTPNDDKDAFDGLNVGTPHVIPWQGGYLLVYEAMGPDANSHYRLGFATSPDGLTWERLPGNGWHGAALDHGGPGSWDAYAMGTPYLVPLPDGSLRVYYVGFSNDIETGIGVAACDGSDLSRWDRIAA